MRKCAIDARRAPGRTAFCDAVRDLAPEVHDTISKGGPSSELASLSDGLKERIIRAGNPSKTLMKQIEALPPTSLAMALLHAYRPNENDTIRMDPLEVIEFFARWEGASAAMGRRYGAKGSPGCFEGYVKEVYGKPTGKRGAEVRSAHPEFPEEFLGVMEKVAGFVRGIAGENVGLASRFLSCFLVAQPKTAAKRFEAAEEAIADKRRVAGIQPRGVYADIGCGEDGISCIDTLDRDLLLIDNSALVTGMLSSYVGRIGRSNVTVETQDLRTAGYSTTSIGLANIEFVLHYLSTDEIASGISRLVPSIAPFGFVHIKDPERNCCGLESLEKLDAIRESLVEQRLHVAERLEEVSFSWIWASPEDNKTMTREFLGSKSREELESALSRRERSEGWEIVTT